MCNKWEDRISALLWKFLNDDKQNIKYYQGTWQIGKKDCSNEVETVLSQETIWN